VGAAEETSEFFLNLHSKFPGCEGVELGEGSVFLVLESVSSSMARGREPYGRLGSAEILPTPPSRAGDVLASNLGEKIGSSGCTLLALSSGPGLDNSAETEALAGMGEEMLTGVSAFAPRYNLGTAHGVSVLTQVALSCIAFSKGLAPPPAECWNPPESIRFLLGESSKGKVFSRALIPVVEGRDQSAVITLQAPDADA
jgi:hypothetical protein